jgi:hypothetical protein
MTRPIRSPTCGLTGDGWFFTSRGPMVPDLIHAAWARDIRPRVRCTARRSSDGQPCRNYAMHGQLVCHAHGGRAPQARRAAAYRLAQASMGIKLSRACVRLGVWPPQAATAWRAEALRSLGIRS